LKVVLLLAGLGRRLGNITRKHNKCLIELNNKPLLGHLLDGLIFNNLHDIIPIVGHDGNSIIKYLNDNYAGKIECNPAINSEYKKTNNMYSLWCARQQLDGKPFILCNGDSIIDKRIIKRLVDSSGESEIVLDVQNRHKAIDSPGTILRDKRILDLGRHIPLSENGGYAIGLYKYGKDLSTAYFGEVEKMLGQDMLQAGFHDPLLPLLSAFNVQKVSTGGLLWTDIDTAEDIPKANKICSMIMGVREGS